LESFPYPAFKQFELLPDIFGICSKNRLTGEALLLSFEQMLKKYALKGGDGMPRGDGTGPDGQGPVGRGRGRGSCGRGGSGRTGSGGGPSRKGSRGGGSSYRRGGAARGNPKGPGQAARQSQTGRKPQVQIETRNDDKTDT
jgi:hypothetical protein